MFAFFQLVPSQRENTLLSTLRWPAAVAFLGNAFWAAYTQFFGLSAILAVIILWTPACLLVICRQISSWNSKPTPAEIGGVVVPLSVLAAWLTAASIVNISASLRFHGIEASDAAAPLIGAAVLLLGGALAAFAVARGRGNLAYAITFLWALVAIMRPMVRRRRLESLQSWPRCWFWEGYLRAAAMLRAIPGPDQLSRTMSISPSSVSRSLRWVLPTKASNNAPWPLLPTTVRSMQ